MIFNLHINFVNFVGIALTIAGGAFYSYVEFSAKQQAPQNGATSPTNGLANGSASSNGGPLLPALGPATVRKRDDDFVPLFHRKGPSASLADRLS